MGLIAPTLAYTVLLPFFGFNDGQHGSHEYIMQPRQGDDANMKPYQPSPCVAPASI